ncbi:YheC/YheD family protein [Aquibacillus salsiterrae]|uniref:YheC/YheD family protein n=1 Tax=Aquibacillus salsiterrae TaxID=2950439 RepID=A0A9X4AEX7_9BACI|nr:YheC/YheD family protein [Aquibacillus salsiterrae]MDC3417412.1 YheC/YheD family protein [Aquibacillus salsiterrae]
MDYQPSNYLNSNVHLDKNRLFFNKWEMYKLLAPHRLPFRIPYTALFSKQSLHYFVYQQAPFYIKPIDTWAGKKIARITPEYGGYTFQLPNGDSHYLPSEGELLQQLLHYYSHTHTIIQEHAPILPFNNRSIDIRVHMQRDKSGYWLYAGDLVRIGGEDAIVSNLFSKGGGVADTNFVLSNMFNYYQVNLIKKNLKKSGFAIANLLDYYYHFIDIGADFSVDHEGNLWLLEVNTNDKNGRPSYDLFKELPNKTMHKQMVAKDKERKRFWKKKN